jgi:hypothetical protein
LAKKKETAAPLEPTMLEAAAEKGLTAVREYQNAIIAGLLLAAALTALVLWKASANEAAEDKAWVALAEAQRNKQKPEDLAKLEETYAGTQAAPYLSLLRATRLTEAGTRKDLEQARDILTHLVDKSGSSELLRHVATTQLDGVKKELDDGRTWKAMEAGTPAKPDAGPVGSPAQTAPPK